MAHAGFWLPITEIQDSVALFLYLHARLCHHRGQLLPQLDLLPAPHQPAGVFWGSLWLPHQQGWPPSVTPAIQLIMRNIHKDRLFITVLIYFVVSWMCELPTGGDPVCCSPHGDDNCSSYWGTAGWLLTQSQNHVYHKREETHELWRYVMVN